MPVLADLGAFEFTSGLVHDHAFRRSARHGLFRFLEPRRARVFHLLDLPGDKHSAVHQRHRSRRGHPSFVVCLDETGLCSGKGAATLTGLAPRAGDSGGKKGRHPIRGRRGHTRTALFMAALPTKNATAKSNSPTKPGDRQRLAA
ncbi:MAG: transposase [Methylocella sp.]|nr:MAG: hypothetical protein DLM68_15440 [Hyphomicrobiales bacterium]